MSIRNVTSTKTVFVPHPFPEPVTLHSDITVLFLTLGLSCVVCCHFLRLLLVMMRIWKMI